MEKRKTKARRKKERKKKETQLLAARASNRLLHGRLLRRRGRSSVLVRSVLVRRLLVRRLLVRRLLVHRNPDYVLAFLVGEFEVIFDVDVFFDLEEDHGRRYEETAHEKAPARGEFGHEGGFLCVHSPHPCCACGL